MGVASANSTARYSFPNQQQRLSASKPSLRVSSTHRSFFSIALIPSRTSGSRSHRGMSSKVREIHTSSIKMCPSHRPERVVGSGSGRGIAHSGLCRLASFSQYLLNFRMAVIRAGFRLAIALLKEPFKLLAMHYRHY